ncbi:MBL fold metallo-hydrolase [Salsipaludibacter albus]|uniref:MBL fold metallo-hydrolase n=1 Tax=Salsipaludibacter albus TaxID=2849650 RepID=UPI001EE3BBD5
MSDHSVTAVVLGRWQTNCVVISDHATRRAVVVDPGEGGAEQLPPVLARLDVEAEAILLTHGHLDHLWSAPALAEHLDVPVHLHPADRWLWDDPGAGLGLPGGPSPRVLADQLGLRWDPADERLRDLAEGQRLDLAGVGISVAHTPGHTPGSVTFLLHDVAGADVALAVGRDQSAPAEVLLSGDLLFAGSIGRVDLPGGDMDQMTDSLRRHLPALADDTLVVSGHGPDTTIGHERSTNPFVRRALAKDHP